MLRFVPDDLKTKRICKNTVEKFPFVMMHVPDWYKTHEMWDKYTIQTGEITVCFHDC